VPKFETEVNVVKPPTTTGIWKSERVVSTDSRYDDDAGNTLREWPAPIVRTNVACQCGCLEWPSTEKGVTDGDNKIVDQLCDLSVVTHFAFSCGQYNVLEHAQRDGNERNHIIYIVRGSMNIEM
jgi:hypothetical protein